MLLPHATDYAAICTVRVDWQHWYPICHLVNVCSGNIVCYWLYCNAWYGLLVDVFSVWA